MDQIFVTNKNDFDHADRFNGMDYVFPAGERALIPCDAAAHMFGLGRRDKEENLIRLGWANLPDDAGVKRLAKFVFTATAVVEASPVDMTQRMEPLDSLTA